MVLIAPLIGAATLFSSLVVALPRPGGSDVSYGSYESSQGQGSYDQNKGYDNKNQDYGKDEGNNYDNGDQDKGYGDKDKGKDYDNGDKGGNKGEDGKDGKDNGYGGDYGGDKGEDKNTEYNQYTTSEYNNGYTSEYENTYTSYEQNTYTETSTAEYQETTEYQQETTTAEYEQTTEYQNTEYQEETQTQEYTQPQETSTAEASYSTPAYGSGGSNWGGSGYDDCVQQCMASFAPPGGNYAPTATSGSGGSEGTGATITVIVAPTQGVLRFMPFAVNASVGDTVKFMWGANNHTVTKGSALLPCNKSGDNAFASGLQNKDFVFTQVVNDTNPTYFYCAAPNHCQKGMFGIINPVSNFGAPSSASAMWQSLTSKNPDLQAYSAYTSNLTAGSQAGKWGGSMDLASMPDWAQESAIENIMFTRNVLANNQELLQDTGLIDLGNLNTTPLMVPPDVGSVLANAGSSSSAPASPAPTSGSGDAAAAGAAGSSPYDNGASSVASPKVVLTFMAVVATYLLL